MCKMRHMVRFIARFNKLIFSVTALKLVAIAKF